MTKEFRLWLYWSLLIVASHYILIRLIYGTEPLPTDKILMVSEGDFEQWLVFSETKVSRYFDLLLGPYALLIFFQQKVQNSLIVDLKKYLALAFAGLLLSNDLYLMAGAFFLLGLLLQPYQDTAKAINFIGTLVIVILFIVWSFPHLGIGVIELFIALSFAHLGLVVGYFKLRWSI
jgi:hypothetical protein